MIDVTKNYTDAELKAMPPLERKRPNDPRSPFAKYTLGRTRKEMGEPLWQSSRRWAEIHLANSYAPPADDNDPTDKVLRDLSLAESGWHRQEGPGGVAFFPSVPVHPQDSPQQLKLENDWEENSLRPLLEAQKRETLKLEEKPIPKFEDVMAERRAKHAMKPTKIREGGGTINLNDEIQKFEDSDKAVKPNTTKRGD